MGKPLKFLGLALLLAFAGYGAYWYVVASQAERVFKERLTTWKRENHARTLAYDSIKKEGFPWDVSLVLVNPRFSSREPADSRGLKGDLEGTLKLSMSLWGPERLVETKGKGYFQVPKGPRDNDFLTVAWAGDTRLRLIDQGASHLEILRAFLAAGEKAALQEPSYAFSSWESSLTSLNARSTRDGEVEWETRGGAGETRAEARESTLPGHQEIDLKGGHVDLFCSSIPVEWLRPFVGMEEEAGNVSIDVEGTLCYPNPNSWDEILGNPFQSRQAEVSLKINKLDYASDLLRSSVRDFVLALRQEGTKWTLEARQQGVGTYTTKHDAFLRKKVESALRDETVLASLDMGDPSARERVQAHASEIAALTPSLSQFGEIKAFSDLRATAWFENNQISQGEFNLERLEYAFPPYDISIATRGKLDKTRWETEGAFKLTRFQELANRLNRYLGRIDRVHQKIKGPQAPDLRLWPLGTREGERRLVTFLREISDAPDSSDEALSVSFSYTPEADWKVGHLGLKEFEESARRFFAPPSSEEEESGIPAREPADKE